MKIDRTKSLHNIEHENNIVINNKAAFFSMTLTHFVSKFS